MKTQFHEQNASLKDQKPVIALVPQIELIPLERKSGSVTATADEPVSLVPKLSAWRRHGLFAALFVLPVFAGIVYFAFIASDIYVSETKFILRSPSKGDTGAISSLSQGQVSGRSDDDAHALIEYVTSRDAARAMEQDHGMKDVMARPEVDIFSRYPSLFSEDNQERYYRAYRHHVDVILDSETGIVTLLARAYRPEDARQMATSLLQLSDTFINGLNSRASSDAQSFAKSLLAEAQLELVNVESEIAAYRNAHMVLDPGKESEASLMQLALMTTEISKMEAALAQQQSLAANSPSVNPLIEQIKAYREQIEALRKTVVGTPQSVASKIKDYELLTLQRDIAGKKIVLATAQFEKTRQEAQSRRVYLQTIVEPSQPDIPELPRRFMTILGIAAVAFALYRVAKGLIAATMEHQQ